MRMEQIDAKTPPTEFSWTRCTAYGAIMMATWAVITLLVRLLTSWDDKVTTPGIAFGIAMGIALEYLRRDKARKEDRTRR
ncbi:hypothetical protein ACF3NS_08480 [Arsenicicoccus cauae]|uniref:Uncharacterized protein n=1 Tax=Arsenicicoccus cauae TaxID=2663847 RepID=A0A6I3IT56_9MICO|nr:hypothetical protein [Arsenicicoccus cauae]MTB71859.1 hypothetical protein [Arsenicicoccus cauae]